MDLVRLTAHAFGVPACHLPHQHTNPARGDCGRFVSDRHVALTIPARDVTTGATPRAATKRSATGKKAPTSASTAVAVVERIEDRELHEEAKISYLAYAMSVVVDRALPDVRDGLKPVHRRILYAMHDLGLSPTKPFKKCARIVGEVLGKYHPHGDQSVYNALVRLAQDFSMREPLISGHGNFGSLDDDPAAAMRYTECRLRPLTVDALMSDLEDGTVDFAPTFDGSQTEPSVLPARVPLLLINGAMGIAVGMATNIPPHNMREVVAALRALIAKPDITVNQLMAYVPAPDFPTGGEIVVTPSIADAYRTGSGSTVIRGAVTIENPTGGGTNGETNGTKPIRRAKATATSGSGSDEAGTSGSGSGSSSDDADGNGGSRRRSLLVISEIPYGVNKSELVSRIAELTEDKTLDGVADVRDESDRTGTRVVVEVRRGHDAQVVLNQVFKHTRLQTRFGTNITALVDGSPQELNLLQCLQHFLDFRVRVVERRARFYLSAAQARLHLVEGFLLTTRRSNEVVQTIRSAADSATASTALQSSFGLSHVQAQAVLALPLRRLAGQEQTKLEQEEKELQARVADLQALLANRGRVRELVGQEAQEVADKHGNPRRTALVGMQEAKVDLVHEDLTPNRQSFIMWSRRNFIKRVDADFFEQQQRGGKGKMGGRLRANDALEEVVAVHDHDQVLLVSEDGRGFPLKAYDIPDASRASGGTAIAQLIRTTENVPIAAMLSIPALPPRGAAAAASAAAAAAASASNDAPADDDEGGGGGALDASDPAAGLSLVMVTTAGSIKRVALADARSNRKLGITLFKVPEGDRVGWAAQCREDDVVLVASSQARVLLFPASSITQRQRSSGSVLGMRLPKGQRVVSMCMLPAAIAERISSSDEDDDGAADGDECVTTSDDEAEFTPAPGCEEPAGPWVLTISNLGYGKRTLMTDMRVMSRGCKGSLGHRLRKGEHLAAVHVLLSLQDEVVMASDKGLLVKISADAVPLRRRVSSGNKLMNMGANSQLQTVTVVRKSDVA